MPEHRISRVGERPRLRDVIRILVGIPTSRYWAMSASTFFEDCGSPRNPDLPPALPFQHELEGYIVFPAGSLHLMEMEGSQAQHRYEIDGAGICGCDVRQISHCAELGETEVSGGIESYQTLSRFELSADPTRADQLQAGHLFAMDSYTSQSGQAHLPPQIQHTPSPRLAHQPFTQTASRIASPHWTLGPTDELRPMPSNAPSTGTTFIPSRDTATRVEGGPDQELHCRSSSETAGRSVSPPIPGRAPNGQPSQPDRGRQQVYRFIVTVETAPPRTITEELRS
ncbi:hypothetical protein B0T14DRAFT_490165 [Immersiella caudata]|uniref:Uncharacterized protein n=1 Tax=Immersiella caudata TaxID=314043 RepID=A0AA40CBQ0_9PEZI|nr:hypothetical protein B0T14DRAFT_490165 [Immersiella caudata]